MIESKLSPIQEMLWIPDDANVFELAKIVQDHIVEDGEKEQQVIVETIGKKSITQKKFLRSATYDVDKSHMVDLDNIIEMNSLHEAPLLDVLRRRWFKQSMYTFAGDFMVSINPYKLIPGLDDNPLKYLDLSTHKEKTKLHTPHVYAIANNALREVMKPSVEDEMSSESIIVTGESGAGKTEASKQVMNFLTLTNKEMFPDAGELADKIKNVILDSNVLFESFGNAKTVRNDNSSRFGKYIKLQYTPDNRLIAAETETFLLEKSRLVSVSKDDRNYHIFYQLVRGLDSETKLRLNISDVDAFKILTDGGCTVITSEEDDVSEFQHVTRALQLMGCSEDEVLRTWELLACILHLGNIVVEPAATYTVPASLKSPTLPIETIASLLGVSVEEFLKALTAQKLQVKQSGENYEKILNSEEVKNNIFALLKWIYGGVFNWLVAKVNSAHKSFDINGKKPKVEKFIGILDIFGFEIFQNNTFEQLCINYTNERLQQQFNELVFEVEQEQYAKEGLDWTTIHFRDNQSVIDLIGKKPQGLLIILEEHSLLNRDPDDQALLSTYHKHHFNLHPNYTKPRFGTEGFVIKHFAGDVGYNIPGFIAKNNDALQDDLTILLSGTRNNHLLAILESNISSQQASSIKSTKAESSVATKIASTASVSLRFRNQLDALMSTLRSTRPFYIKCIKPNGIKNATVFDSPLVVTQLRYSGILELVRIRREGYPTRLQYLTFYSEYKKLSRGRKWVQPSKCTPQQLKDYCGIICHEFAPKGSFQLGRNFLFLHHYVPNIMMTALHALRVKSAVAIQALFRGYSAHKKYKLSKKSATVVQSLLRMVKGKITKKKLTVERDEERKRLEAEEKEKERLREEERKRLEAEERERARLRREEEERLRKEEEARLAELERLRKEEEARLAELERQRLLEEAEKERLRIEEELRLKREKAAILIQAQGRAIIQKRIFQTKCKAVNKISTVSRQYLRDLRNRKLIEEFHQLCREADSVPGRHQNIKDILAKNPQVYHNRWNYWSTMFQSAISTNQINFLKEFRLNPKQLLEKDGQGSRLLHYAMSHPDLATVKFLCNVLGEVKTSINLQIKDDDEDDNEATGEAPETPGAAASANDVNAMDLLTGLPVIKSGWLKKSSTILGFKTFKRRWCVLTEESFVLYKSVNRKPAGFIPIEGCVVDRMAGGEPVINIQKPGAIATKKSLFSSESEHDRYVMKADSEQLAQDWLTALQIAAGVRPFRQDPPVNYINVGLRSKWIKLANKQKQTALHLVAGMAPEVQRQRNDEGIRIAAWLIENGCDIEAKDSNSRTALQLAIATGNNPMIAFLTQRRAVINLLNSPEGGGNKPARLSMNALSRQSLEVSSRARAETAGQHLLQCMKLKGFSYIQIHFTKFAYIDPNVSVEGLIKPRFTIGVYNGQGELVEVLQTIDTPALARKDFIWFGYTWYMQTPLENVGDDFTIIIKVIHSKSDENTTPTCKYHIEKEKINSGRIEFVLNSAPDSTSDVPLSPDSTEGIGGVIKQRMSMARRTGTASGVPTPSKPLFDSYLEADLEITKFYRDIDLETV